MASRITLLSRRSWSTHPAAELIAVLLASLSLLSTATTVDEKQLSVYGATASYTLPVLDRGGHEYVGLLELLEPFGRVTSDARGTHYAIRYNSVDGQFEAGKTRAKIHGRDFNLPFPFLLENSRGLVPLSSLGTWLPRFLGLPVDFHERARRLLVGEIGIHTSFQLQSSPQTGLVINFTAPVNPTISTEPGKVRMLFKRDPVLSPGSQSISFQSSTVTQATYSEANGFAELDVTTNIPLIANFGNGGKTIILSALPSAAKAPPAPAKQAATSAPPAAPAKNTRLLAIIDAAHGGDERGATLTDQLAEKDVTLNWARLLRNELELRGFVVLMLRDSDNAIPLDQRASSANTARGAVYICLHAASQGSGVRAYTALLPAEGLSKGQFHAWNTAQSSALPVSQTVASSVLAALQKQQFPARQSMASLRPLNNLLMPAIAIELAPGPNGLADLNSATYQQQAAAIIADALASVRDRLSAPSAGLQPAGMPSANPQPVGVQPSGSQPAVAAKGAQR
ncbi:MAG: N-acetylmuramoyl-L-alanine amidase [Terriglobales bacterium]